MVLVERWIGRRRKAARAPLPIEFRIEPVERMSWADGTFDVVLSSLMMHHLPDELKPRALREVRRVLKPGGRLVIVDITRPTSWTGRLLNRVLLHGGMPTGLQDLPELLTATGFEQIEGGKMSFRPLGFVRATAGAAGETRPDPPMPEPGQGGRDGVWPPINRG